MLDRLMLLGARVGMSRLLVLAGVAAIVLVSGCSCRCKPHRNTPASDPSADREARGAGEVAAGMVVYRDAQTGEITDSPSDSVGDSLDTVPLEPDLQPIPQKPSKQEPLPGGGVMIKTDRNMHPY